MSADLIQIGRVAFRHEGDNWNAYYALNETMDGAISLGSIRFAAVINNDERKKSFMDLMGGIVSDIIEGKTGHEPTWGGPIAAPAHEKAGHA